MPGDSAKNPSDWFSEFKKVNSGASGPSTPPVPKDGERRRHNRFEIDGAQATLYREGLLTVIGVGRSNRARAALDLSEGGVRFLTHERLSVGSKVRILIQMEKYQDAIAASGEVKWCYQSAKKSEDFYAGVQFVGIEALQARKITLMRDWFTSPQFRAVRDSKRRQRSSAGSDVFQLK